MFEDDLYTELNAKWNAVIIAKPTFTKGEKQDLGVATKQLHIKDDPLATYATQAILTDLMTERSFLTIQSNSTADLLLYLSEIRRIINAYTTDNVTWRVLSRHIQKLNQLSKLTVTVHRLTDGV